MNELIKINRKIKAKQIGRVIVGGVAMIFGLILLLDYSFQDGITDCQKHIAMEFPDEYDAMTEKVVKSFEK